MSRDESALFDFIHAPYEEQHCHVENDDSDRHKRRLLRWIVVEIGKEHGAIAAVNSRRFVAHACTNYSPQNYSPAVPWGVEHMQRATFDLHLPVRPTFRILIAR